MAIYTVHGGHAKHGNKYCGAVGYCSESLVDRQIAAAFIKWMQLAGHTVYDCSVDSGLTQSNIISQIKKKINSHKNAECNVSIHLNAASKSKTDGKVKGAEVLVYSTNSMDAYTANRVCTELKVLGFTNRGVKGRTDLGVLKGITNGGKNILVECFFCDDEDDYRLFSKLGADAIGKAIAEGVLGKTIEQKATTKYFVVPQPTLRKGSHGLEVKRLQAILKHYISSEVEDDGDFGPVTEKALKAWQKKVGFVGNDIDGIYGPMSRDKMRTFI